jgi:hypothetical protein
MPILEIIAPPCKEYSTGYREVGTPDLVNYRFGPGCGAELLARYGIRMIGEGYHRREYRSS